MDPGWGGLTTQLAHVKPVQIVPTPILKLIELMRTRR